MLRNSPALLGSCSSKIKHHSPSSPSFFVQEPFTHGETRHRSGKAVVIQQTSAERSLEPQDPTRSSPP